MRFAKELMPDRPGTRARHRAHVDVCFAAVSPARALRSLRPPPQRSTRGASLSALALLIVLVISACSSGDDGNAEGSPTTTGDGGERTGQPAKSYVELLATVPASFLDTDGPAGDAPLALSLADTVRAEQAAVALGSERASPRTTESVIGLSLDVGLTVPALAMRSPGELPDAAGFGIADIDRFVDLQRAPDSFMSASGTFDPDAIGSALAESSFWGPKMEVRESAQMRSWVWGNDSLAIDMEGVDALHPIGRAVQIAADESRLLSGARVAVLDDALAIGDGEVPTLADDDRFASVAAALDDADAFSAYISITPWTVAESTLPSPVGQAVPNAEPHLSAFDAFAIGTALAGGEQAIVVVLLHKTAEQAAANADLLREVLAKGNERITGEAQPWSEVFSSATVNHEGPVVTASLVPAEPSPRRWMQMWSTRTSLLAVG